MTRREYDSDIEKLKSEIELKNEEIKLYLDKIENLEDTIMNMEKDLSEDSDKADTLILMNQIKHLENYNRELKDKMGYLRLENVRLKKQAEELEKGYYDHLSLIKVVEKNTIPNKIKQTLDFESKTNKSLMPQKEYFKDIELKCPICETQKSLKIPTNIINPSINLTMISIPNHLICEHSFQILIDKSFTVQKYQIENYDLNKIELFNNKHLTSELISKIRNLIDDFETLGLAILDDEWNIIVASIPSESMSHLFKEIRLRKEHQIRDITKIYFEMKNQQKAFVEIIEILGGNYIFIVLFSQKVNFGMGTMLFKDIKEKLENNLLNYKDGIT